MKCRVAPSLLAADFTRLGDEIRRVEAAGTDILHLDIMDGHFVPNYSFGPCVIEALRPITNLHFDVHLMLDEPWKYIETFHKCGADGITVHLQPCPDPTAILNDIGSRGLVRGLSINPDVPVKNVAPFLDSVDRLLIMSVYPGFGGQKFIEESLVRVKTAKELIGDREIEIEIDGGVCLANAKEIKDAGANLLVAGTAIFKSSDMRTAVNSMLEV